MAGVWSHRFAVVLRPLRDKNALETTVIIETRTAAQASREAMALHPEMKVLGVTRADECTVTSFSERTERSEAASATVSPMPLRRASNG